MSTAIGASLPPRNFAARDLVARTNRAAQAIVVLSNLSGSGAGLPSRQQISDVLVQIHAVGRELRDVLIEVDRREE